MISRLTGIADDLTDHSLTVDINGVGYDVLASRQTLDRIGPGEDVRLLIVTSVSSDDIQLYGFYTPEEKALFQLVQTVQGVGAKMALSILSVLDAPAFHNAIMSGDRDALTRANGVGPTVARRLISELSSKVGELRGEMVAAAPAQAGDRDAGDLDDAVSALINLGYGRSDAFGAVQKASSAGATDVSTLITNSLRELSNA